MKRYDYGGCDECSFGQLIQSPEGDWMDADDVTALHAQVAELVRGLPHHHNCAVFYTSKAKTYDCKCARGQALALLGES